MPNYCLTSLAKFEGLLQDLSQLIDFFQSWHGISKYAEIILQCLWKNSILLKSEAELDKTLLFQAKQKAAFQDVETTNAYALVFSSVLKSIKLIKGIIVDI